MDLQIKKEYMIFEISKAVTRDSRPYLRMVLADDSGTLTNGIMFDSNKLNFEPQKGDKVDVSAILQSYNNQSQLKVAEMSFIEAGGTEAFLPKSKNNSTQMEQELRGLIEKHVKDDNLLSLVNKFYEDKEVYDKFLYMPAAKTVHHAYIHGLLEHTLGVVKNAVTFAANYSQLNKNLLVVGALFHDLGKVLELDISAGFDYSDDGRLVGHLVLGYSLVEKYIGTIDGFPQTVRQQILHLMLSHHGQLEFGSPQLPKTLEAMALHQADDIDAKLNNFSTILEKDDVAEGSWSSYDRLLERQIYKPSNQ